MLQKSLYRQPAFMRRRVAERGTLIPFRRSRKNQIPRMFMSTTEVNPSNAHIARKGQQSTHIVQFHANDKFLIDDISHMVGSALVVGDVAVVIAADSRREQLENQLQTSGFDTELARKEGRYIVLDAEATLAEIYRNRKIDTHRFTTLVSKAIVNAAANGRGEHP